MRGGGDGEAGGGGEVGEFSGCAPASTSVPLAPAPGTLPPAISIGLPGLHVGLHVAAAASSSQQRWQPPESAASRRGAAGAGREAAGGARGHRR